MRVSKASLVRAVVIGFIASIAVLFGLIKFFNGQNHDMQPPPDLALTGIVTVTTSPKGWWTFITVEPQPTGQPEETAFVIQYKQPLSPAVTFHGPARIIAKVNEVRVESAQGGGLLFEFPSLTSWLPTGLTKVPGVTGLERYRGNLPRTHEKFVHQRLALTPDAECR